MAPVGSDFKRCYEDFRDFVAELGPLPKNMARPSIGRKDHSKGYIRGNFAWQEMSENTSESILRNQQWKKAQVVNTGKLCPKKVRLKISKAKQGKPSPLRGIKRPKEVGEKVSLAKQGHPVSRESRRKISKALKGRTVPQKVRGKISKTLKESPEHKIRLAVLHNRNRKCPLPLSEVLKGLRSK